MRLRLAKAEAQLNITEAQLKAVRKYAERCLTVEQDLRREVLFKLIEMDRAGSVMDRAGSVMDRAGSVMDINLVITDARSMVNFILGEQEESPATGPEQSQLETSGFDPAWRKKWDDANGNKRPAECDPPIPPSE